MGKLSFAVLVVLLAGVGRCADREPISAADAVKRVGKGELVIEMKVAKVKDRLEKRGIIYLDSEDDFRKASNLGVAISSAAASKMRDNGIADPAAHFEGKTIRVTGCVMVFEERPYLPVLDPAQMRIVEKK